jgi:hypothetical protein
LYRALVHCKHEEVCDLSLVIKNGFRLGQVQTVPSSYCSDLVTPMVQLLKAGLAESASASDKFVFLSQSTLPVKPFHFVYSTLTSTPDSDLCVSPTPGWLRMHFGAGSAKTALLVKHSQWVVLNRGMSTTMAQQWKNVGSRPGVWSVPVLSVNGEPRKTAEMHGKVNLCTDEWAFFATIYGTIIDNGHATVPLQGFGGDLWIHGGNSAVAKQGACHTFTYWRSYHAEDLRFMSQLLDPGTRLSCYPNCYGSHPAEFITLSDSGATVLRHSPYIFARKFSRDVMTLDQFHRIILSATPPPAPPR